MSRSMERLTAAWRIQDGEDIATVARETGLPQRDLERWVAAIAPERPERSAAAEASKTQTAKERRRRENENFEQDVTAVLEKLSRNDPLTAGRVLARRTVVRRLQRVYWGIYVPVRWFIDGLIWIIVALTLLVAVFGDPDPTLTLAQAVLTRVAIVASVLAVCLAIRWIINVLVVGIWDLFGPFALASVVLRNAQEFLFSPAGFRLVMQREERTWRSRIARKRFPKQLRTVERQLRKRLLLQPIYATWGARTVDIMNRRRAASAIAVVEVQLRQRGVDLYEEAWQTLRKVEILTLLRDWSLVDLPELKGADYPYRGWLRSVAAVIWSILLIAIPAASLYFQQPFVNWIRDAWQDFSQ